MQHPVRNLVAAVSFSAVAGAGAYFAYEGYADTARPPVKGDVPTYGFGTTLDANGKTLKGGERIAPPEAVRLALRDIAVHEGRLKKCLEGVRLAQHEFDAFMSLELNTGGVCNSSIPAKLRAGDYAAACKTILDFDKFCTRPKTRNAAGKYVCPPGALKPLAGLTKRRQAEYRMCIGGGDA